MAPADPEHLQAIKARLADIAGIDQLSVTMIAGRMVFGIKGKTIGFTPFAGDDEIETAIRLALSPPAVAPAAAPAPIPTPMPPPAAAAPAPAPSATKASTMTTPAPAPGSFAASLKAMVDEAMAGVEKAKADGLAKVQTAVGKIGEAKAATVRVTDNMAKQVHGQADAIMAELGQISNDLTGEGS